MDEFHLIETLLRPLASTGPDVDPLGLADDAAILAPPPGREFVVTVDMLHAEVHFFADDPPDCIGRKALRVNLSDLAAMGAEPVCYFLSLGLPRDMTEGWITAFADGLLADQASYGIRLAGGDTTVSRGPLSVSITAVGSVPTGTALRRGGARAGDDVWVSGTLGESALGLAFRHSAGVGGSWRARMVERYLLPEPRLRLGTALRGIATAAIDVSDGLAQDLGHLAKASGLGAEIALSALPRSDAMRAAFDAGEADWPLVVSGGDDYELLFTAPPRAAAEVEAAAAASGVPVTRIGRTGKGGRIVVRDEAKREVALQSMGYRHRTEG